MMPSACTAISTTVNGYSKKVRGLGALWAMGGERERTHVVPFFGEGERGDAVHDFAHTSCDRHGWIGQALTMKCALIQVGSEFV